MPSEYTTKPKKDLLTGEEGLIEGGCKSQNSPHLTEDLSSWSGLIGGLAKAKKEMSNQPDRPREITVQACWLLWASQGPTGVSGSVCAGI